MPFARAFGFLAIGEQELRAAAAAKRPRCTALSAARDAADWPEPHGGTVPQWPYHGRLLARGASPRPRAYAHQHAYVGGSHVRMYGDVCPMHAYIQARTRRGGIMMTSTTSTTTEEIALPWVVWRGAGVDGRGPGICIAYMHRSSMGVSMHVCARVYTYDNCSAQ